MNIEYFCNSIIFLFLAFSYNRYLLNFAHVSISELYFSKLGIIELLSYLLIIFYQSMI